MQPDPFGNRRALRPDESPVRHMPFSSGAAVAVDISFSPLSHGLVRSGGWGRTKRRVAGGDLHLRRRLRTLFGPGRADPGPLRLVPVFIYWQGGKIFCHLQRADSRNECWLCQQADSSVVP